MKAKTRNERLNETIGTYTFIPMMALLGVHEFGPVSEHDDWDEWYLIINENDPTHGCVYHASWLEEVEDV